MRRVVSLLTFPSVKEATYNKVVQFAISSDLWIIRGALNIEGSHSRVVLFSKGSDLSNKIYDWRKPLRNIHLIVDEIARGDIGKSIITTMFVNIDNLNIEEI